MTPEEKAERARQRMIEKSKEVSCGTYLQNFVATRFQKVVKAEAGAMPDGVAVAVFRDAIVGIQRYVGEVVCVTCGKVTAWDARDMNAGHFIGSRRNSILLEESNCAPQCVHCNQYQSGNPQAYRMWMEAVHGVEIIEMLQRLKTQSVTWDREQQVDMRIEYDRRLRVAIETMKRNEIF